MWLPDVEALRQEAAQELILTKAFHWGRNEDIRVWTKRFEERMRRVPQMGDAGDYASTPHYLTAIEAAGTDEAGAMTEQMRDLPINDMFTTNGKIRIDGRTVHDTHVRLRGEEALGDEAQVRPPEAHAANSGRPGRPPLVRAQVPAGQKPTDRGVPRGGQPPLSRLASLHAGAVLPRRPDCSRPAPPPAEASAPTVESHSWR